jgi:hypothetical protein
MLQFKVTLNVTTDTGVHAIVDVAVPARNEKDALQVAVQCVMSQGCKILLTRTPKPLGGHAAIAMALPIAAAKISNVLLP